jgi:hypothetical protein
MGTGFSDYGEGEMSDLEMEVQIDLFIETKLAEGNSLDFISQMLTDFVDLSIKEYALQGSKS